MSFVEGSVTRLTGRRKYVRVGSMTASMVSKPLPNTPTPPYANAKI
jgi:hypothetical protein